MEHHHDSSQDWAAGYLLHDSLATMQDSLANLNLYNIMFMLVMSLQGYSTMVYGQDLYRSYTKNISLRINSWVFS